MSLPLEQKGDLTVPAGLSDDRAQTTSTAESGYESPSPPQSDGESHEPFSNLKLDERHFEDQKKRDERRAQLVMGPPLGGNQSAQDPNGDQIIQGEELAENEDILADLPDDALDLELTHMRLRSLRGLGIERFTKVQVTEARASTSAHSPRTDKLSHSIPLSVSRCVKTCSQHCHTCLAPNLVR